MDSFEPAQGSNFDEEYDGTGVGHSGHGPLQSQNWTAPELDANSLRQALQAHLVDTGSERTQHGTVRQSSSTQANAMDPSAIPASSEQESAPLHRTRNIEDCVLEMLGRPVSTISPLYCPKGDTWIFIRPPAREPEYSEDAYQAICERYNRPFVGSYATLMKTQSPLFKKQLGDATQQFRIIRRLKVKQEMENSGIKYVLDLTPPDEGDEAVQITSDLSCPLPVLNWVHEAQLFKISDGLVAGIDELSPPNASSPRELPVTSTTSKNGQADYTPLRHRAAIERVLLCLHGFDIVLDSAPKLYTTVMAATKHLQIPAYSLTSLTDYVTAWLRAVPNNVFIELHPDVSLQIADALQIEVVCQDSFSILVGEAALEAASKYNSSLDRRTDFSIHSRLLESIDEVWETRLQYARNAFMDRIQRMFSQEIIQPNMRWVELLPQVTAIPAPQSGELLVVYSKWLSALKNFAKGAVYHILCSHYTRLRHLRNSLPERPNIFSRSTVQFQAVFNKLSHRERLLTRSFWSSLAACEFQDDRWRRSNTTIRSGTGFNIDTSMRSEEYVSLTNAGEIKHVTSRQLEVLSFQLLEILNGWSYDGTSSSTRAWSLLEPGEPGSSRGGQHNQSSESMPLRMVKSDTSNDDAQALHTGRKVENLAGAEAAEGAKDDLGSVSTGKGWFGITRPSHDYKFDVARFVWEVEAKLQEFGQRFLIHATSGQALDFDETDTLVCLNQDEMKYLPLWAGGMDDGSNGVFDADLPTMPEDSSFGPARQDLRRTFAESESDYDGASTTLGAPTIATSRMVNDGRSVIMDRRQVYAEDEIESVKFDDSVSNAGTETTWEGIDRDDISVSTSSELAGAMSRTQFGLHSETDTLMEEEGTEVAGNVDKSDLFALSDEEEDQGYDDDEIDLGDSDQEMLDDSDFEVIETTKTPPATQPASTTQKRQSTKQQIASWAAANPDEAKNVIKYRERSQSPLVFEKS